MRIVPALAFIISTLVSVAEKPAHADPLCPLGWICEVASEFRLGKTFYTEGVSAPTCSLVHVVRTQDSKFEFHTALFVQTTAPVSEYTFLAFFSTQDANGKLLNVPLRDLRIVSADRILDTKDWVQRAEAGKLRIVGRGDIVTDGPVARTAIAIATGGIYGALLTTEQGAHIRFEIRGHRLTEAEKLAVRRFRDCAESGRPPPEEADRG